MPTPIVTNPSAPAPRGGPPPQAAAFLMDHQQVYADLLTSSLPHPLLTVAIYSLLVSNNDIAAAGHAAGDTNVVSSALQVMEAILTNEPSLADIASDSPEMYIGRVWLLIDLEVMTSLLPASMLTPELVTTIIEVGEVLRQRDALESRIGAGQAPTVVQAAPSHPNLSPAAAALRAKALGGAAPRQESVGAPRGAPLQGFARLAEPAPADSSEHVDLDGSDRVKRVLAALGEEFDEADPNALSAALRRRIQHTHPQQQ